MTPGSALAASFCMMPASGRLSLSGGPPDPEPWHGRSVSDSESEELLKSTLSPVEDGAMMEGRMMPSPSSPTARRQVKAAIEKNQTLQSDISDIKYFNLA